MTRWSRHTIFILLALLVLVSITLRYPMVEHERHQTDSYFIHHLSDSIAVDGVAKWTYHPLSYVGYYPLSYPSGVPFLVAESSVMSGVSVELSILSMNMMIAVAFCLGVFLVARHFVGKPELAIMVTYFAILGSRFVDTSYWNGSARGPAIVFMVLVLAVALRTHPFRDFRLVVVSSLLIVGCLSIHHMAVLLLLFGAAYVVAMIHTNYVRRYLRTQRRYLIAVARTSTIVLVALSPFFFFRHFWESAVRGLQGSALFNLESELLTVILVGITSYTNQIGLIIVFATAYVFVYLGREDFSLWRLFPLFLVAFFIPLAGETLYISMILSPFAAIMGTLWFDHAFGKRRKRRDPTIILLVLLVVSMAHPMLTVDRWNSEIQLSGDRVVVGDDFFNDAHSLDHLGDDVYVICNVMSLSHRLQALTDLGFLGSGISLPLNGDVSREDVRQGVQSSPTKFPKNIYNWYGYNQAPPVDSYVRLLMVRGVAYLATQGSFDGASEYFSSHRNLAMVIDNRWQESYLTTYSISDASLPKELFSCESTSYESALGESVVIYSYVWYQSESISSFLVQLPL